jgi:ubiquinone/menaquinone biosynthesis C-methylase UbiE
MWECNAAMRLDPLAFEGLAAHYSAGRPPYSALLPETLGRELDLDGTGHLLDVGCGPGVIALTLRHLFEHVSALDPSPDMLTEGQRRASALGITGVRWIQGVAEDLPTLGAGPCRLVTFGQSFHRTDRLVVAEMVYEVLEPGGAIALIAHDIDGRPEPPDPGFPRIPHEEIRALVVEYLGQDTQRYLAYWAGPQERFAETLARSSFGTSRQVFAPGRPNLIVDIDTVVADCFSKSYSAPRHFGGRLQDFDADLRQLLHHRSRDGRFWDWPGDTEIVLAVKPSR